MKKYTLLIAGLLIGFLIWPVFIDSQVLIRKEQIEDGYVVLIGSVQTASTSATIDFTTGIDSTYDRYMIVISNALPTADADILWLRVSQSSSFLSGGTNYAYAIMGIDESNASVGITQSVGAAQVPLTGGTGVGSATGEGVSGVVYFSDPDAGAYTKFWWDMAIKDNSAATEFVRESGAGGLDLNTTAIDGVRLKFSTDTIASGTFALYGFGKT